MSELFESKGDLQIVRLSEADARGYTDHLHNFRKLVIENEPAYPNIQKWVDRKVIPGMRTLERVGYIGYLDGKPAVSALVRRGKLTKFCHLKLKEEIQDAHLGEAFFALMSVEARMFAKEVHFTLPESLWRKESGFFKSFGFTRTGKAEHQYRLFDTELSCSASFSAVWEATIRKLPKIARVFCVDNTTLDNRVLMSIKAEYAQKVLSGKKKVEIRRRFSRKWTGKKVCLYATRPKSSLVGEALISRVVVGAPEVIWQKFENEIGCTRGEFESYTGSLNRIYAIVFEEARPYAKSIPLADASNLTNKSLRPPQSYCDLDNSTGWAEAISMGALLQQSLCPKKLIPL